MGYAQAAIKCIVNTSSKQSYKPVHHGFAVFGIRYSQANQPSLQATGEWVGAEKIAERRVATKARITSQSSPRVFSEIFCSTHPERGARQPTWQVSPTSQRCKLPQSEEASQPPVQVPQQATLAHHAGKHPQPHKTCAAKPRPRFARQFPCRVYWLRRVDPIFCKFLHRHLV